MRPVFLLFMYTINSIIPSSNTANFFPCRYNALCRCKTAGRFLHIDCSFRKISRIPHFPRNTRTLNLSTNYITSIENNTFQGLKNLTMLDLTSNKAGQVKIEPHAFNGLENLRILFLANNSLLYNNLPKELFIPLKSLVQLNLKFNTLPGNIAIGRIMTPLLNLESLQIDISNQSGYLFDRQISSLHKLRKLVSGYCSILMLDKFSFAYLQQLEYLDLSSCSISKFRLCAFCKLRRLEFLSLNFHLRSKFGGIGNVLKDMKSTSIISLKIRHLLCVVTKFPGDVFVGLYNTSIQLIEITDSLRVGGGESTSYKLPPSLQHLDLSNDTLMKLSLQMPYLTSLNVRYNSLGAFLADNIYMTSTQTDLKIIDLSWNSIYHLMFSIFHGHPQLEQIDLSHNNLVDIPFDMSHLINLRLLNISYNSLSHFNDTTIHTITNLFKNTELKIDLTKNALNCGCHTVNFLRWMLEYTDRFERFENYTCKFDTKDYILFSDFKQTVQHIDKVCSKYTLIIALVSAGIIATIFVLCCGLIYRYRWTLRYMYYMTRSKYYRYKPVDVDEIYTYNAFVSYSDNERDFIINECIPNLEEAFDMRLCLHQRDFLPGQDITVNMTNAIHDSKRIVCVITRAFLESYFCMFEFNMARMEGTYSRDGQNVLLLVFYDRIQPKELPLMMLELVQQQSYIEYPHDAAGNVLFWKKMKEVLI